jgi:peptidyl-prolyl cis-trans isomerase C
VNDIVATVNGDPITQREVQATLEPQLQGRDVDPQLVQQMQQQVVNSLVESRLIEQYVTKNGPAVDPGEVKAIMEQIERELAAQQIQLPQFLASRGHTVESFRKRIEGSVAWQKFQQEQLSDENLSRYFQQNQNRFNAESLEEVRQEVSNAYLDELWKTIISQMKPDAEVQQVASPQIRRSPETVQPGPQ